MNLKIGDRIEELLKRMSLLQDGRATDFSKDQIAKIKPTSGHGPSFRDLPLVIEWRERFERMILAAERDLQNVLKSATAQDLGSNGRRKLTHALRQKILEHEGRQAVWVAFVECCSVSTVEQVRKADNRDGSYGFYNPKPITSREVAP
jgi:hypothetical protein